MQKNEIQFVDKLRNLIISSSLFIYSSESLVVGKKPRRYYDNMQ